MPRVCESLKDDAAFITTQAESWIKERPVPFSTLHVSLARAVIVVQLREQGAEPDFDLLARLLESGRGKAVSGAGDQSWELSESGDLSKTELTSDVCKNPVCETVVLNGDRFEFKSPKGSIHFGIRSNQSGHALRQDTRLVGEEWLDADKVGTTLTIRNWLPGDHMQPLGMSGSKKLQDIFIDEKVALDLRKTRLVLTTGDGRICWVEGFRIAEWAKVDESTKRIVFIRGIEEAEVIQ